MMVPAAYMALFFYPVAEESDWGVSFPDLPGCVSSGATFEKALANAEEALAGHVAMLLAERAAIPPARFWAALMQDTEVVADVREHGGTLVPVPVRERPAPKERINIMIDPGVLRRADAAAKAEGISRSAYFERAVVGVFSSQPAAVAAAKEFAASALTQSPRSERLASYRPARVLRHKGKAIGEKKA